jgi:uncharacterized protein YlxP (DUF503 family)
MFVAAARITLHLPASQSLKDKRQVVRSLLARLRNQFEVAAAEVDSQDKRQLATLGLSYVSADAQHAEEVLDHAARFIEATRPDVEISDVQVEILPMDL